MAELEKLFLAKPLVKLKAYLGFCPGLRSQAGRRLLSFSLKIMVASLCQYVPFHLHLAQIAP